MRRFSWLMAIAFAVTASMAAWRYSGGAGNCPVMPQSAYVWQRAWTPSVVAGVTNRPAGLCKLIVLAAQVDWDGVTPRVTLIQPDYDALRQTGAHVGLALRVAARRTPLDPADPAVAQVAALARSLLAAARLSGIEPIELQVDYDSAESRLGEYRAWIGVVRQAVSPVPLTVTMLPCWLGHRDVAELVRETDGFVLQVHSLSLSGIGDTAAGLSLVDANAAILAVQRAGALGVPFDVALPTYGYVAAFDPEGRLLGLDAEGPQRDWPRTAVLRDVRADPQAMAWLVSAWTARRPGTMRGVIWYRLPVTGDRCNWAAETLECVMRGQVPQPSLSARALLPGDGRLVDVELENNGQADAILDGVRVTLGGVRSSVEAQDGVGGFVARQVGNEMTFVAPGTGIPSRLRPGERRRVGWVRLQEPGQVKVEVVAR